jgi:AcrR family transcriptional regulator
MHRSATPLAAGLSAKSGSDLDRTIKSEFRGRPRSEESEEAILAATIDLLSQMPLREISMEEIARKAGVGKATIYKWWPSRAYVALDAFLRKFNQSLPAPDTGSVRRDILEQLRSLMVFYQSPTGRILGQFVAECQIDKEFASLFRERFLKPRREVIGVIFDRGVQRGEIDQKFDRELVLDLIYGPAIYRMIIGHAPLEVPIADEMVSILFGGLDDRSPQRAAMKSKAARRRSVSREKVKRQYPHKDK